MTKTNKFSLNGWSFGEWLKGNGKTVKELIKVGVPFGVGGAVASEPVWIGITTVIGKLILDGVEYYFKE